MKVSVGSHRDIGEKCKEWARDNMPEGFELVNTFEECDIFISVLYDRLLSETEIASKKKCFNFHPGILPYHRGSGSYSWVIINNEQLAGVTLHEVDRSIDHGNVIATAKFPVQSNDTAETLFKQAEHWIFDLFKVWFPVLLSNEYGSEGQNESVARIYYRKELELAKDLTRYARAFHFPGKEQAYYYNEAGEKIYLKWK